MDRVRPEIFIWYCSVPGTPLGFALRHYTNSRKKNSHALCGFFYGVCDNWYMYRKLVFYTCVLVLFILVINALANVFYWYTAVPGFDKFVHTLGGTFLALLGSAMFYKQLRTLPVHHVFVTTMLFVFVVGLLWEYYEYLIQAIVKNVHLADLPDSIGDLVNLALPIVVSLALLAFFWGLVKFIWGEKKEDGKSKNSG